MEDFEITRRLINNPAESHARALAMLTVLHSSIKGHIDASINPGEQQMDAWLQQLETAQMLLEVASTKKEPLVIEV